VPRQRPTDLTGSVAPPLGGHRRPAISAHRGGSEDAPAQTWEAFRAALAHGAEHVEFDVRRCADGVLVAYHHARAGRTGAAVGQLRYPQLCAQVGHEVPRVAELMPFLGPHTVGHVDLKEVGYEADVVTQALDAFGLDRFLVSSREETSLRAIQRFDPTVRTALSLGQRVHNPTRRHPRPRPREDCSLRRIVDSGCAALVVNHWLATPALIRNCAARDIDVLVWTVNDVAKMTYFLTNSRVAALITDRPRRALGIRAAMRA
jgi:glycerophosphoryl diester phosphodiesterase